MINIKHQPATPLPYHHKHDGKISAVVSGDGLVVAGSLIAYRTMKCDTQNHAYLTHAGNAYQKLVAALREATESLDDLVRAPEVKHFRQDEATRFYTILRELGEAS